MGPLPFPPLEMRALVGPTDLAAFDNPGGGSAVPQAGERAFGTVLDFGCGCGRIARQFIQQRPQPLRYVGVDLHAGMVRWCQQNLAPAASQFSFLHHDVFNVGLNPSGSRDAVALPAESASFDLVLAHSVFTHILEDAVPHYLAELARVLRPSGVIISTWFLFDKGPFPMMQPSQNALYVNPVDPTQAAIYDRQWFRTALQQAGLRITSATPPAIRGFHWEMAIEPTQLGRPSIELPEDDAPLGSSPPPVPDRPAHLIGS